ncbi:carbohydrate-binding module family 50 protein [Tilletiaria anomala UBC 951]|uniref:Carbohydrate-binding module family 50 protein n=1 Tax=Tilletiaria anomala (strain ATCC 24038 / CBS 436.72 / UBC 951) TaxID=1037660 RepID=A0A066WBN5_TILAU|nr:carbohydrate-binding module family 50 protein [Tilletiaria anomala UBC 951]KDN48504.1 carbohydrate-binding module family 50 protein [Tilletiaria anomala UBC 951]
MDAAGGSGLTRRRQAAPAASTSSSQLLSQRAQGKRPASAAEAEEADNGKVKGGGSTSSNAATSINTIINDFDAYAKRTQDRLEAWFGIAEPSISNTLAPNASFQHLAPPLRSHGPASSSIRDQVPSSSYSSTIIAGGGPSTSPSLVSHSPLLEHVGGTSNGFANDGHVEDDDGTSLVYLHRVRPDETLAGISLQYGIEPALLRRVNKLWAGDKPQMRGTLYLPVHACSRSPHSRTQQQQQPQRQEGEHSMMNHTTSPRNDAGGGGSRLDGAESSSARSLGHGHGVALGFWNEERGLVREIDRQEAVSAVAAAAAAAAAAAHGSSGNNNPPPLQEDHRRQHDRAASSSPEFNNKQRGSASPSHALQPSVSSRPRAGSFYGAGGAQHASPQVSRVPNEELKFFSSVAAAAGSAVGTHEREGSHRPKGSTGYGQSGLDDLLQISQERSAAAAAAAAARVGGSSQTGNAANSSSAVLLPVSHSPEPEADVHSGGGSGDLDGRSDTDVSYSDRLAEERWKPNKWTLGGSKKSSSSSSSAPLARGSSAHGSSNGSLSVLHTNAFVAIAGGGGGGGLRPLHLVNSRLGSTTNTPEAPASIPPAEQGLQRASSGWNDAPPAGANVAHAYSGKANAKQNSRKPHHRLLNDLVAGLPPNPGPASGWQRPIGASLPPPPPGQGNSGGGDAEGAGGAGRGFGKVLNDALRGRISVEGALEAMYDQVTGKAPAPPWRAAGLIGHTTFATGTSGGAAAAAAAAPPRRLDLRSNGGSLGRVSAEEARASLSLRVSMEDDAGAEGRHLNGVQLDHLHSATCAAATPSSISSNVQPHLRAANNLANGSGPRRVRSRAGLKDVEWHKEC